MRYRQVYTPTDYTTITPEMVKRWMAMEARLDASIRIATEEPAVSEIEKEVKSSMIEILTTIKDGKQ